MMNIVFCLNNRIEHHRPMQGADKKISMQDLTKIKTQVLVDTLAKYTNDYLRMLREGTTQENYSACKKKIDELMAEIEVRKKGERQSS